LTKKHLSLLVVFVLLFTTLFSSFAVAADEDMVIADDITIKVDYHVQTYGDKTAKDEGTVFFGTEGEAKRLEKFNITLEGAPADMELVAMGHVQKNGDMPEKGFKAGEIGTSGEAKRLEGLALKLVKKGTDELYPGYSIQYQVHMQWYGWGANADKNWRKGNEDAFAADGEYAGTKGEALRLEGASIIILKEAKLAVKDVSADNLKQVVVEFNQDVDTTVAGDAANYSFKNAKIEDVDVDGSTVTLTLEKAQAQQSKETLTVSAKILDTKAEFPVQFVDRTFPEVVSAEVVGDDTIKVIFTEPMDIAGLTRTERRAGFSLTDSNDKKIYVDDVKFESNNTVARVSFNSVFKEGTYDLTVNAKYKDYAGFTVLAEKFALDVVPDVDAPELIDFKDAKPYGVTLVFDEDIIFSGKAVDVYHTNTKNAASTVEVVGNEMRVKFNPDEKMPSGTVYVYVKGETVKDYWGNKQVQQQRIAIEVVGDDEAPEIVSVKAVAQDKLEVTFDEEVDTKTAETRANYKVLDEDGDELKNIISIVTAKGKVVTLNLNNKLNGDNTLVVEKVEDIYGNAMKKTSFDFFAEDTTAPEGFTATLYDADKTVQRLIIDFGEAMAVDGAYSVLDIDKYKVGDKNLNDYKAGITISALNGNKKVEISLDKDEVKNISFAKNQKIVMARVADEAGNRSDFTVEFDIALASGVGVDSLKAVSKTEIKLTLKDTLADFDDDDFILYTSPSALKIGEYEVDEDSSGSKAVITFTLIDYKLNADGTIKIGDKTEKLYVRLNDDAEYDLVSENEFGATVDFAATVVADGIASGVVASGINAVSPSSITVKFEEDVSKSLDSVAQKALGATDFVIVNPKGDTLKAGVDYEIEKVEAGLVTIKLTKAPVKGHVYTISTIDKPQYIQDEAGNKVAKIKATDVTFK